MANYTQQLIGVATSSITGAGQVYKSVNQIVGITGVSCNGLVWKFPVGRDGIHETPCLPITYRESWIPPLPLMASVKGSTLTNLEIDANFKILQDAIISWQETEDWARAIIANRYIKVVDLYNDTPTRAESSYIERDNPDINDINDKLDLGYSVTGYTLQPSQDYNHLLRFFNTTPKSLIIPTDSTFTFPIGSAVLISWNGGINAIVTVIGQPGVTIRTPDTNQIARPYGKITCIKTAPNYWELEGNLAFDYTI